MEKINSAEKVIACSIEIRGKNLEISIKKMSVKICDVFSNETKSQLFLAPYDD